MMNLLVVIVCYRATELTIECLRSLGSEIRAIPEAKVAVCENGTGGDSARTLADTIDAEGWGDWVSLTAIHPNRGFSGGNNVILRQALALDEQPRYFLLLNSDTIVRPGALAQLLAAAEQHPHAGIIGPRLEWPDGTPQVSCFHHVNPVGELLDAASTGPLSRLLRRYEVSVPVSNEPIEVDWTSFACALIRREVMQDVGVLDDGFYLYFDDPDYCRRARLAGWAVLHWPAARVVHLRGRSNPVKSLTSQRKRRPAYWYASRARYYAKFYGRWGLWGANLLWTAGRSISLARELFGRKRPHTCAREWLDIWTNCWDPLRTSTPPEAN